MKDLKKLKGAKIISKKEQKNVTGGARPVGPCGFTGGVQIDWEPGEYCPGILSNGECWVCY